MFKVYNKDIEQFKKTFFNVYNEKTITRIQSLLLNLSMLCQLEFIFHV